jgi:hypothetical protein
VLYLTWSRSLTALASEHVGSFAPSGVELVAQYFTRYLAEICGYDLTSLTLFESRANFVAALDRLGVRDLGPWRGKEEELHAELRAFTLGRALDEVPGEAGKVLQLEDDEYRALRGGEGGLDVVEIAVVLRVADALRDDGAALDDVFPELVASTAALRRLRDGGIPESLQDIDRVVVDEIQDLTLQEMAVVVEFTRALVERRQGREPVILLAGDEGQTVRPTGFAWGPWKDLIASRLTTPREFNLDENLRCPDRIVQVLERASQLYDPLPKGKRPSKQRHGISDQPVNAHLLHVDVRSVDEARELLAELEDVENLALIAPTDHVPEWVPAHLRDLVMGPSAAKGLEYQSVCLLDAGRELAAITSERALKGRGTSEQRLRTRIDQLRVSLSRATETLAFVDVDAGDEERAASLALLGDAAPFDPEDLREHFDQADRTPEDRVLARTQDARVLIDEHPRRAWRRAHQGVRFLLDPELPNGVTDESVRREAHQTLLATAARLLVDGLPDTIERDEVTDAINHTLAVVPDARRAFEHLEAWTGGRHEAMTSLLSTVADLEDGAWIVEALSGISLELQSALREVSVRADSAKAFTDDVERWLEIVGYAGDHAAEAQRLRQGAFDALLKGGFKVDAEAVLDAMASADPIRTGRLREAQGRHEAAAVAFESAAEQSDALRNWRAAGLWERALGCAESGTDGDLRWLVEADQLMQRRPELLDQRLTLAERSRLKTLLRN